MVLDIYSILKVQNLKTSAELIDAGLVLFLGTACPEWYSLSRGTLKSPDFTNEYQ